MVDFLDAKLSKTKTAFKEYKKFVPNNGSCGLKETKHCIPVVLLCKAVTTSRQLVDLVSGQHTSVSRVSTVVSHVDDGSRV